MDSIRQKVGYLKKDELVNNGMIMFISGTVASIFNYVYQVYMGRALGPEAYGVFGALFAIFYLIGIISSTLGTSTTQFVSRFVGEGKHIGFFIKGSLKRMILLGSVISLIFLVFSREWMGLMKLSDIWPILILILILFLSWITPILNGSLQALKKFNALGFTNMSNTFFKLIFGIAFVVAGFGVSGALFGVAAGSILGLILSYVFLKPYIIPNNPHEPDFRFSSFYLYSFPVMVAMIGSSIPSNLDVIMANYFFSPADAGIYTSVSVLGKIVFYFSGAVGTVMFPAIVEKYIRKENTKGILKKSILYAGALSGCLELIYILFPQIVVTIFGNKYINAIDLVAPYGLAMFFVSIIAILLSYHLAIKNMGYIACFSAFTIIEVALLFVFNSSMSDMIDVLAIVNFIFLALSIVYTFTNNPTVYIKPNYKIN
jgi:O-antigen/teichoic acid export membrane protein